MITRAISEPNMPSWMKTIGKTMMVDPIMVLVMEVIVLKELSVALSEVELFASDWLLSYSTSSREVSC